jgi:hypothetical protein
MHVNVNQLLVFTISALSLMLMIVNYQNPATAAAWAVSMTGWITVYLTGMNKRRG